MAFLMNLLALVLVVAISWFGMMWLAGKFHGRPQADAPCKHCKGTGARHKLGRLEPCPACEGTGTRTTTPL